MTLPVVLWGAVLLVALAALSWIDARTFRLPDALTLPLIAVGLFQSWYLSGQAFDAAIGAVAGYLFFFLVEKSFHALRGKEGLGRGDAKLLAAGGAWCGWGGAGSGCPGSYWSPAAPGSRSQAFSRLPGGVRWGRSRLARSWRWVSRSSGSEGNSLRFERRSYDAFLVFYVVRAGARGLQFFF